MVNQGIQKQIAAAFAELTKIDESISDLRQKKSIRTNAKTALTSEKIQSELIPVKNAISENVAKINQFEIEISDSRQFISTLEKRLAELNYSLLTRKILGELPLTHCPQCLSKLETGTAEGHCFLCKQPLAEEAERANAKRLKQEMELQIKESRSILEEKDRTLVDLNGTLPALLEKARTLQKQLDDSIDQGQTTRDERIDSQLIAKGGVEKKIEFLTEQIKGAELLELLKKELSELAALLERLRLEIQEKETQQRSKLLKAMEKIREYTLTILRKDLERQDEFHKGKIVDVNFQKDYFTLDDENNFSASSKIIFKNAVLFSIFFSSLALDFFRYPRFILCDNMEDKGMEKIRSQNFQNVIVELAARFNPETFQIIFTTSEIADELDNTPYCVGVKHDKSNRTLKV